MDLYKQKLLSAVELHYKNKDYERARVLYTELMQEYPERIDSPYYLAMMEAEQNNFKGAIKYLHKIVDYTPSDKAYNELAKFYLIEKNLEKALKYLKLALIYNSDCQDSTALLKKAFPKEACFIKPSKLKLNDNFINAKDYPRCKYQMIHPAEVIERKPPKYVEELLTQKQKDMLGEAIDKYKTSKCRENFVIEIPNGRAFVKQSEQTYIFTEEGQCIKDMLEQERGAIKMEKLPPEIKVADKMLVLSSSFGGNFYHWLTWTIPRLDMIEKAGYKPEDFDRILINYVGFNFQRSLLENLGIPLEKIIGTIPEGSVFSANTLVSASLPCWLHTPHFVTQSLRERFIKPEYYSEDLPKILYLSRNKSTSRKIINEKELVNYINNMGFSVIYPEQMAFEE